MPTTNIEATIDPWPLTYIGDDVQDGVIEKSALPAVNRNLVQVPDTLSKNHQYLQQNGTATSKEYRITSLV